MKKVKKILSIVFFLVLLVSVVCFPVSAVEVSQTFDFLNYPVTFSIFDYNNTPSKMNFVSTSIYEFGEDVSYVFGRNIVRRTVFSCSPDTSIDHFSITESYTVRDSQVFAPQYVAFTYYCRLNNEALAAAGTVDVTCTLNGQTISFVRSIPNVLGQYYMFRSDVQFSQITDFTVKIVYNASDGVIPGVSSFPFYSSVMPITLTQTVEEADLVNRATYTAIQTGVIPSLDNIEQIASMIEASQQAQSEKLNDLYDVFAEDNNTMLADKVSEAIERQDQAEYDFASEQGEALVSDAIDLLPLDSIESASSAFSGLVSSFTSNGRDAKLIIPAVSVPTIHKSSSGYNHTGGGGSFRSAGSAEVLLEGFDLIPQTVVDLDAYFDDFLPPAVLVLLRSFVTGSLALFVVKELISLPLSLLNNKGGDSDG